MRHPHGRWAILSSLVLVLALAVPGAASGQRSQPEPAAEPEPPTYPLTLVTGDELVVERLADGRQAITVDPAARTEAVSFETVESGGQTYVFPSDAAPLVPEVLDRELFNVTRLIADGYADGVPVIVDYEGPAARAPRAPRAGMAATATLESIGAVAATIDDGQWWQEFQAEITSARAEHVATTAGSLPGIEKVWLDARVEAALEDSVPQIGAPAAWAAGFDGTGTTVAVLDTGIDTAHPDLAGTVVASRGCTDEGTTTDGHGHGTHVASTIAGTGAASGGLRTGVAPGAVLLNGKALNNAGFGLTSWIISCMEWAVAEGADVVSMSLGGDPTDGTDPLSQAVDELTESSGTLFAIAAGNDGRDNYISAPGAASSAITVGAVSKQDVLASFSNRGPRRGDFALKPDITGPGVGIIAARAAGTSLGSPVDEHYTALSGTSMATPHVAGAAAVLKQQHATWTADQLKAALVSSADPSAEYSVYEQGGGRVDIGEAVSQPVYATPAPLDLGYFLWPHEGDPVTRTVTYANESDADVDLDLDLDLREVESGDQPPAGMVTLSDTEVTVPAHGSVSVMVTVDTRLGDYGFYSGYLTAASTSGPELTTPVGLYKEDQRYTLTVEAIARDGDPAEGRSYVDVLNVDDIESFNVFSQNFIQGSISLRVPPGTYSVMGSLYTCPGGPETDPTEVALVGDPEVEVTGDTQVTLDARSANPVNLAIETHDAVPATDQPRSGMGYMRRDANGVAGSHTLTTPARWARYAAPTEPVNQGGFEFNHRLILLPAPSHTGDEFLFDAEYVEPDVIPPDLDYVVDHAALQQEFAHVDNHVHANDEPASYLELRHHWRPYQTGSLEIGRHFPGPVVRTDFVRATDSRWGLRVLATERLGGSSVGRMFGPDVVYEPGEQVTTSWYRPPFHPTFRDGIVEGQAYLPSVRDGDVLDLSLYGFSDSEVGHSSLEFYFRGLDTAFRLYQDSELVGTDIRGRGDFEIDPGPHELRLEFDTDSTSDHDWAQRSTSTRTAWTVHSPGTADQAPEVLPLLHVDYDIPLDLTNRLTKPGVSWLDLHVRHQVGADAAAVADTRVWFSTDDGQTWQESRIVQDRGDGHYRALFLRLPRWDDEVSIKVAAWDGDGNRIEQEIIRAFRAGE